MFLLLFFHVDWLVMHSMLMDWMSRLSDMVLLIHCYMLLYLLPVLLRMLPLCLPVLSSLAMQPDLLLSFLIQMQSLFRKDLLLSMFLLLFLHMLLVLLRMLMDWMCRLSGMVLLIHCYMLLYLLPVLLRMLLLCLPVLSSLAMQPDLLLSFLIQMQSLFRKDQLLSMSLLLFHHIHWLAMHSMLMDWMCRLSDMVLLIHCYMLLYLLPVLLRMLPLCLPVLSSLAMQPDLLLSFLIQMQSRLEERRVG